jgi:hypothetical protein
MTHPVEPVARLSQHPKEDLPVILGIAEKDVAALISVEELLSICCGGWDGRHPP